MTDMPSHRPSARPSAYAGARSSKRASYQPPSRSIKPSEPRSRALFAGVCLTIFGAFVVSAFVRSCEGEDFFETSKKVGAPAESR